MRGMRTRVTQKGQVTIPVSVRKALGLRTGDSVIFTESGGVVTIEQHEDSLENVFGAVQPVERPEDWTKVRQRFEELVAEDVLLELVEHTPGDRQEIVVHSPSIST